MKQILNSYDQAIVDVKGLSKIDIYALILSGIYNYVSYNNKDANYQKALAKGLKFNDKSDPHLLLACRHLLEDSQSAIDLVFQEGLSKNHKNKGEMYLRLYGVLNAYYQQYGAIMEMNRLFNLKNQKERKLHFKGLELMNIRAKLGSHSTSYLNKDGSTDFFRISQPTLSQWGEGIHLISEKGVDKIDLFKIMREFTVEVELALKDIVEIAMTKLTFGKENRQWLEDRFKIASEMYQVI